MCSTTFLTTLDRILRMLVELVNTELQAFAPRLGVPDVSCTASTSNKSCSYCHKRGHVRRRCYHATRACFECGSPDHFVKECPLKRTLSFLTDPISNVDSGSASGLSITSRKSNRERNSTKVSDGVDVMQFNCTRSRRNSYIQFKNSKAGKSEAASVPIGSSTSVSPSLHPSVCELSFSAGQSLGNQAVSSLNCGSVKIPGVSPQLYSWRDTTISAISASPAGVLRTDQSSFLASGSGKSKVILSSADGCSSGEVTLRAFLPVDSVAQFSAPSVSPIASAGETTSGFSFAVPAETAAVVSSSDGVTAAVVSSVITTAVLTTAITSTVSSATPISLVTPSIRTRSGSHYSSLVSLPKVCNTSAKSVAGSDSNKPIYSTQSGGPYKRVITRISPSRQPVASGASMSFSTLSSATSASVSTGGTSITCDDLRKCLRLYKTTRVACRDYVAVKPMADCETLYDYATRFTGALKNAFPGVNTDTRRDLIDIFVEGLTRIYLMRVLDVKDEKCVKNSRKPFATFIGRVLGEI